MTSTADEVVVEVERLIALAGSRVSPAEAQRARAAAAEALASQSSVVDDAALDVAAWAIEDEVREVLRSVSIAACELAVAADGIKELRHQRHAVSMAITDAAALLERLAGGK